MTKRRRIPDERRCSFTKENGKRCMCFLAKDNNEFCHIHAPYPGFECSVCYSRINDKKDECKLPSCSHKFCTTCITAWFKQNKSSCPMCREKIPTNFICLYDPYFNQRQFLPAIYVPWSYINSGSTSYQLEQLRNLQQFVQQEIDYITNLDNL